MATKVLVNYEGSHAADWVEGLKKKVADALGVLPEDVICLPGVSLAVVDVPDAMTKAREKADKDAEKAKAEAEKAEAAAAQKAAQEKADRAAAEAAGTHSATAETEHVGRRQKAT